MQVLFYDQSIDEIRFVEKITSSQLWMVEIGTHEMADVPCDLFWFSWILFPAQY